jgi:hypothetical protein
MAGVSARWGRPTVPSSWQSHGDTAAAPRQMRIDAEFVHAGLRRQAGLYLYVWGAVFYNDGISKTERTTRFCHRYNCANVTNVTVKSDSTNSFAVSFVVGKEISSEYARYHRYGNDAF